ncbi:hypothetical protein [Metabacillus sp. FJAT-52054]|uniref:Uncharacterized protein n=1 Tax=Metabacillus sediminis TaxID=3117746 RepID=A0ABZ2NFG1_9BACI
MGKRADEQIIPVKSQWRLMLRKAANPSSKASSLAGRILIGPICKTSRANRRFFLFPLNNSPNSPI